MKVFEYSDGMKAISCPGCQRNHGYDSRWTFNGDFDKPTFSPSLLVTAPHMGEIENYVCHSFVRDGRIDFLNDCTHSLAGQTVDLPDVEV